MVVGVRKSAPTVHPDRAESDERELRTAAGGQDAANLQTKVFNQFLPKNALKKINPLMK